MEKRTVAVGPKRVALLIGGFAALVLAVVGAILPVMPTTPFLLIAVYCFAKSSIRCHRWLTQNRVFGRYVTQVAQGRPLSWRMKAILVASCWATALMSVLLVAPNLPVKFTSLGIAAGMTAYVLLRGRRQLQAETAQRRSPSL